MVEVEQHVAGEQVAFGLVRVAGQDERFEPGVGQLGDLRQHLVGIADDRRPGTGTSPADTSPEMTFDVAVGVGKIEGVIEEATTMLVYVLRVRTLSASAN